MRAEDRWLVDLEISRLAWTRGDAAKALAAADSVLARQSDSPGGLRARAAALALAERWDEAFAEYDRAVRLRTGIVDLRCDYAFDLIRAGRFEEAGRQLDEARLLDEKDPTAEALRASVPCGRDPVAATTRALAGARMGPVVGPRAHRAGASQRAIGLGDMAAATWAPVRERLAARRAVRVADRRDLATWVAAHRCRRSSARCCGSWRRGAGDR